MGAAPAGREGQAKVESTAPAWAAPAGSGPHRLFPANGGSSTGTLPAQEGAEAVEEGWGRLFPLRGVKELRVDAPRGGQSSQLTGSPQGQERPSSGFLNVKPRTALGPAPAGRSALSLSRRFSYSDRTWAL